MSLCRFSSCSWIRCYVLQKRVSHYPMHHGYHQPYLPQILPVCQPSVHLVRRIPVIFRWFPAVLVWLWFQIASKQRKHSCVVQQQLLLSIYIVKRDWSDSLIICNLPVSHHSKLGHLRVPLLSLHLQDAKFHGCNDQFRRKECFAYSFCMDINTQSRHLFRSPIYLHL